MARRVRPDATADTAVRVRDRDGASSSAAVRVDENGTDAPSAQAPSAVNAVPLPADSPADGGDIEAHMAAREARGVLSVTYSD